MPSPLKVIFLEDHMDPAATTIKKILPELMAMEFKNFYEETDSSHTIQSMIQKCTEKISEGRQMLQTLAKPPRSKEKTEDAAAIQFQLNTIQENLRLLQLVNTHALNYKAIDPSDALHASLALIDTETGEIKAKAQDEFAKLVLKRSEAMCETYLRAKENTFGVMGYAHATEIMDALDKLPATEKDHFVFIYIYNGDQFEQDEEFLEMAKKNTFSCPLSCFDTSKKNIHEQILHLIQTALSKPAITLDASSASSPSGSARATRM